MYDTYIICTSGAIIILQRHNGINTLLKCDSDTPGLVAIQFEEYLLQPLYYTPIYQIFYGICTN